MSLRFEWDRIKAVQNVKKHDDVSFEEATTVFRDRLAFIFDDEAHSRSEYRELIIGHSNRKRLLIVSFTERDGSIRIISARKADAGERSDYENERR